MFVFGILCKHVSQWVCVCVCVSLAAVSVSLFCDLIFVTVTFLLSRSHCAVIIVDGPASPPLSAAGPSQGLPEGLRHEAAYQV